MQPEIYKITKEDKIVLDRIAANDLEQYEYWRKMVKK